MAFSPQKRILATSPAATTASKRTKLTEDMHSDRERFAPVVVARRGTGLPTSLMLPPSAVSEARGDVYAVGNVFDTLTTSAGISAFLDSTAFSPSPPRPAQENFSLCDLFAPFGDDDDVPTPMPTPAIEPTPAPTPGSASTCVQTPFDDVPAAADLSCCSSGGTTAAASSSGSGSAHRRAVRQWTMDNVAGVVEKQEVTRLARVQMAALAAKRDASLRFHYGPNDELSGATCDGTFFPAEELLSFSCLD